MPAHVTIKLYDEIINKREKERLQNIERRKAYLMKISQLPERMKKAEEESKNKKRAKDDTNILYDYVPKINHEVPDFKKLHEEFERQLQSKKAVHEKVIPVEFNVTKREEEKKFRKLNETVNDFNERLNKSHSMSNFQKSINSFNKAKAEGEKVTYKSTKKMEQIKEERKREKEEKLKEEKSKKLDEEMRQQKIRERNEEFKLKMKN